nr:type II toxin-antitoxin system CcdA family antitoxin [uncultured Devosia sp.]
MATPQRKEPATKIDREYLLKVLDMPLAEFREARKNRSEAERQELTRLFQKEFADAIADYNRYVEEHGLPLEKYRTF